MNLTERSQVQTFLTLTFKSKNNFIKEFRNYDNKSKGGIFQYILNEIEKAILKGNVDRLSKLSNLIDFIIKLENLATVKEYYENLENPVVSTNFVILACKHNKVNILEYLFSKENTLFSNLSNVSKKNTFLPEITDEEGRNAFYYSIRSNNVDLLFKLINNWPDDYFLQNMGKLDQILSAAYEELKLRNVPISEEMEMFVQKKLIDLRFFTDICGKDPSSKSDLNSIRKRVELVLQNIDQLTAEYSNDEEVDEKFLFISRFVAKNLHILKRLLKSTYSKLPWEEIEFCLVSFICSVTKFKEINLFFNVSLNKSKIVSYLEIFGTKLNIEMDTIEKTNIEKIAQLPNLPRDKIVAEIINSHGGFKELYDDFKQIKDMYCLKKIGDHINMAVSCDANKRTGQLIILRALQTMGEYFKNTLESPNLSHATSELLLLSLPNNTRKIITDLRNSLSHAYSLSKRTEIEENIDKNIFIGIQKDITIIRDIITSMLSNNKIKQIVKLLRQFVNTKSTNDIKNFTKIFNTVDIELENMLSLNNANQPSLVKLEKLIKELNEIINDKTSEELKHFSEICDLMRCENTKLGKSTTDYLIGLASLKNFCRNLTDHAIEPNRIRSLKYTAKQVLRNIDVQMEPINIKKIAQLCTKITQIAMSRIQKEDYRIKTDIRTTGNISKEERFNKVNQLHQLTYQIFYIIEFETSDLKVIEQLREQLQVRNANASSNKQIMANDTTKQRHVKHLSKKLTELTDILNNSTTSEAPEQQVAIEMLLLDIMSILSKTNAHLENNLLFLDDNAPLLTGKCLRDHLAHSNALIDILSYDPTTAIILNAKKFSLTDILVCKRSIGKVIKDDVYKLKHKYDQNFKTITNQEKMFNALEEGDIKKLTDCLKEGTDIKARNTNLWTTLHFAAKGGCLEIIRHIVREDLDVNAKNIRGQTPLHISALNGKTDVVEYFLRKMNVNVDDKDNQGNTPLILAAKNGHKNTVAVLLKNKANMNIQDKNGISAVHFALLNNHSDTVKTLLEKEDHVDANQICGGFSLLHAAAENGNLQLVEFFLDNGADVNFATDQGAIPLHLAALNGHLEIVNTLIQKGAKVNARNVSGGTSLHNAVENGHLSIASVLLKHKADVNAVYKIENLTPLHYAAQGGYEEITNVLLKYKADVNIPTVEGITPLHFAVLNGHLTIVEILLKHNVNIHIKAENGYTPLHLAVDTGQAEIVKLLINCGGDVNDGHLHIAALNGHKDIADLLIKNGAEVTYQDVRGVTPLHSASLKGNNDIVDLLIRCKAKIDAKSVDGMTPLHLAAFGAHQDTVRLLIQHKADVNAKIYDDLTPLHMAVKGGNKECVNMLLKHEIQIDAKAVGQVTPLNIAIQEGHREIVELLIEKGANVNNNTTNQAPLISAIQCNNKDIVEILIANGADITDECLPLAIFAGYNDVVDILLRNKFPVNANSTVYDTPLHMAAMMGNKKIINYLIDRGADVNARGDYPAAPLYLAAYKGHDEIVNILLSHGADVNHKSSEGLTALHVVAIYGFENVAQVLLNNKADVNMRDDKNRTPLELAVAYGHLKIVKKLLQTKKVNINLKGTDDFTILHIASQKGNLEMVEYLTNEGCKITAENISGSKPIHIAAREGHKNIVEYFLSKGIDINDTGAANQTLLHYAAIYGHSEVAKFLITKGADINFKDINGSTPMHIAVQHGCKQIIELLLDKGATYNAVDNMFAIPFERATDEAIINLLSSTDKLFKAVRRDDASEVLDCLESGACVNARNIESVAALHYAAWQGYGDVVDVLLKNKADVNITNNKGITPLHYAAKFSHFRIVQALLSKGAIYDALSENKSTPLDFAADENIINLFGLLHECFKKVKNGNSKVISDLNKINDLTILKAIMGAQNTEGETIILAAIRNNFAKVDQLKEISQGNVSDQISVASMLLTKGNYQNALSIFKNIFDMRKEILGPDSPATLEIQTYIAKTLYKQGAYQEAFNMLEEIFEKQESILGSSNKDTLNTRSIMALIMHRQGKDEEAFPIYQDVYQKQTETLGQNHPDTQNTELNMALVLDTLGKHEEALHINKKHFERLTKQLGPNNPATVVAQNNIALVLNNQGKYDEALKIYKEVYEKKKVILGIDHVDTLRTLRSIASVYECRKQFSESLKAYQEVLNIQQAVLGNDHPETLITHYNVAQELFNQGKLISALKVCKKIIEPMKSLYGSEDKRFLIVVNMVEAINMKLKFDGNDVSAALQHIQNEFNTAAGNGDVKTIKRLLNDGADVSDKDANGVTPLHYAVSSGHLNAVNILLENGADVAEVSNKGNTSLHIAISKNHQEIVEVLLRHVSPHKLHNFVNAKTTTTGTTALHVASANGCLRSVNTLFKYGAIYNIKNKEGKTARDLSEDQNVIGLLDLIDNLFEETKKGDIKVIETLQLLDSDQLMSVMKSRNENGNTLIQVAGISGQKNIARKLIQIVPTN